MFQDAVRDKPLNVDHSSGSPLAFYHCLSDSPTTRRRKTGSSIHSSKMNRYRRGNSLLDQDAARCSDPSFKTAFFRQMMSTCISKVFYINAIEQAPRRAQCKPLEFV